MSLIEFLQELSFKGVKLEHDKEKLRIGGVQTALTPDVIAQLQQHKTEILHLLHDSPDILNIYPLSYGQQAMWFLWQLAPEEVSYNAAFPCRICSQVNVKSLQKTFQILIERHPQLRSTFPKQDNKPVQQLHPTQLVNFQQIDASSWSEQELHQRVFQEYQQPFDIENGPIMRVRLFSCSEQEHVLLLTAHHVAVDAWSLFLLMKELIEIYPALESGVEPSLTPLKHSYVDYVRWQRELLTSPQGEKLWNYWEQNLAGELPVLNLPTDRPRPPIQTHNSASHNFKLSPKLTQQLKQLAQKQGVTQFMVLLAAFQVLLYRYTGQEDILVGVPTSGRTQAEFALIVGDFVNSVVMRANLSGNPSFQEFLTQVRPTVSQALAHEDFPFALLVERLQPQRDPSRSPIFQASFNFQLQGLQSLQQFQDVQQLVLGGEIEKEGFKLKPFEMSQQEGQFDLDLVMAEVGSSLFGAFKYNTDLFDASTIDRMSGHFHNLLESIITNPQQNIQELPLLSAAQQHQLIVEWNNTKTEDEQNRCIHQLFEQQVEKTPDAVAVVFENEQITYRQLNQQANQLAHYLQKLGVKPEIPVGICVERSIAMIVGLLGILKAGGAYVPLDPAYATERLAYVLKDAHVSVLLTQKKLVSMLPEHQAQVLCLDSDWEEISKEDNYNPINKATTDNLIYIIYTSGSTGQPKGVQITHGSVVNFLNAMRLSPGLTEQDILLAVTTLSFDIAALEIYLPLIVGARLVVVSREVATDGRHLLEKLASSGATVMQATPATWRMLLASGWQGSWQLKILCGGEALDCSLANQLLQRSTEVWNLYGPTETTIWSAAQKLDSKKIAQQPDGTVPIGRPIANTQFYILDKHQQLVPIGVPGELHIGGAGLARGYINQPELTADKFIRNPFEKAQASHLYKTGDLARYLSDGSIEFLGRRDYQVKIRGFRIELGEIEAVLSQHPKVQQTVVLVREEHSGDQRLVAYVVPQQESPAISELRYFLKQRLPQYMIPAAFMILDSLPLTPNGKIDRRALPNPEALPSQIASTNAIPQTQAEKLIAAVWQEILHLEQVGIYDNFFDIGGHSLLMVQVHNKLKEIFPKDISIVDIFKYPTISDLAKHFSQEESETFTKQTRQQQSRNQSTNKDVDNLEIAIVGISCRFPGAENIETFWQNLRDGVESISFFSNEELRSLGVEPELLKQQNYIKARATLPNIELFDAEFFGFSPKEAKTIDPQHRFFLEVSWEALESAGYNPKNFAGKIGVYAGVGMNTYLLNNLYHNRDISSTVDEYQLMIGNDKDFLPTRISYKLNLNGPSVNVQTACSTSLVAVHLACQSLRNGECDMALAGGVAIQVPQQVGYLYTEGMILSPDGHCRAFDAQSQGTVPGNGVGVVILKRLADAQADGDCIHAIIKGSAINNDGAVKVGYTAPSVDGQAAVIADAQAIARIDPETITYVEAHGTGTALGDPIEIAALTQAFQKNTSKQGFCAIGSVKTNIGHLDAAAGIAGLLKTVLALKHKLLPPSLHFEQPNPKIDFANSPFYVNTKLQEWESNDSPRRAGVSSFGIGGTNAHILLEEAPSPEHSGQSQPYQLLVVSAKTNSALDTATANLAAHLKQHPEIELADVAYTLSLGRQTFNHRRFLVCQDTEDAVLALSTLDYQRVFSSHQELSTRSVVFMFPGQGAQYVNMARELYELEATFREQVDICSKLLKPILGLELSTVLYPNEKETDNAANLLQQTAITQPALFAIEYALAKLWMQWGVHPIAMIGHSIGEYVAACLAGVFSLEDALALVAARAQLMQQLPHGTMLAVHLTEKECQSLLNAELSIAAVNGSSLCVVSGSTAAIEALENQLASTGVECQRLHTSHAFHSSMMNPILDAFTQQVKKISLQTPKIPYLSNVTGTWITAAQATDPSYWSKHLRSTVRFADGLLELFKEPGNILLEVGPGRTLSTLAKRHPDHHAEQVILSAVRHPQQNDSDVAFLLNTLGQLWLAGVQIDWLEFYTNQQRHRLPLPTYPFERQRYWVEASSQSNNLVKLTSEAKWQPLELQKRLADYFLSPIAISQRLESQLPEFFSLSGHGIFNQLFLQLESTCVDYVLQAFEQMGWQWQIGERFSTAQLGKKLGVVSQYQQLVTRLLEMLAEAGTLLQIGNEWEVIQKQQRSNPQEKMHEFLAQYPDAEVELSMLQNCGDNLAAVLQGKRDPLELLHRNFYLETANQQLQESPITEMMQTLVQKTVLLALEQCQGKLKSTLRVLEIGAGTGLTTSYILPILNPSQTEYVFTDISHFFTVQGQDKFRDYPFVRYQLLNIEQDPSTQGFGLHEFDLVIAANVLHATQDMHQTLQHVRQLLAPGGMLVLLELTGRLRFMDLTFGLTEGWWRFTDYDLRPDYALLSSAKWLKLLQESGFSEVATIPSQMKNDGLYDYQAVIVAQNSVASVERRNWLILCDAEGRGQQLAALLQAKGDVCTLVFPGEKYEQLGDWEFEIDATNLTDWQRIFESLSSPVYGIIHLWSLDAIKAEITTIRDLENTVEKACRSASVLVQCLNSSRFAQAPSLWLVTRGTQPVEIEPHIYGLAQSRLWKIGKAIAQEHPWLNCVRVDLDPEITEGEVEYLFAEISSEIQSDEVAFRGQIRYIARQITQSGVETDALPQEAASDRFAENATEMIKFDDTDKSLISVIKRQVAQVLGIAPEKLDTEQPLSNLGLDSLVVIELRKRISNELKVDVPLASFLDGSSIAKLENQIKEAIASPTKVETWQTSSSLVTLQPSGSEPAVFCVHPVAGVVFPYYELACLLGEKQSVYGLQSVGFGDDEQPLTSIEEMAAHYIKDLRAVQPTGPYRLVGWSFGAIVAFEMAVQLEKAGQKVDLLAVIDSPSPSPNKIGSVFLAFKFVFISLLPYIWPYVYDYFYLLLTADNQLKTNKIFLRTRKKLFELTQTKLKSQQPPRSELLMKSRQPNVVRLLQVVFKNFQAASNYLPSVYAGKIDLLRTNEKLWGVDPDGQLGWSHLAKEGVEIHQIPGHHLNVLRTPNVQVVAEKLKACFNRVHSQTKGTGNSK